MVMKRRLIGRGNGKSFFICIVTAFVFSSYLFASQKSGSSDPGRTRVFVLKNISAESGKKYLSSIGVDTVSQIPDSNTILVTAQQRELLNASAVLRLVDSKEKFVINKILPAQQSESLPPNEKIELQANILIGTFANPPEGNGNKVIIDVYKDSVIAVSSAGNFEKILAAISYLQDEEAKVQKLAAKAKIEAVEEPDEQIPVVKPEAKQQKEESDFLGEFLDTLVVEAEKEVIKEDVKQAEEAAQALKPKKVLRLPEKVETANAVDSEIKELASRVAAKTRELSLEEAEQEKREVIIVPKETDASVSRRSYEPAVIGYDDEMLDLDLPEKLAIGDLLRLVGEYLHLDYMYDAAKVKGDVTLKLRGPIKVKDLYPLLESVLKFKHYVMTRKGNLVTIVPKAEVLDIDPVLVDSGKGEIEVGDILVTRIFKLKHIGTASAKNLLDGMKVGTNITSLEATGTLIVTGYAYRMGRVEELLEMVDKPGEAKEFRFRQLRYTMANTLAPSVKALAEQLGTVSVTVSAPAPAPAKKGRARPKPAPRATPPSAKSGTGVYLEADERTNRILMIGLKLQLDTVEELIDTLDVEQQDLRKIRVYEIQYVGAEEVQEKLSELGIISTGRSRTGSSRISARPTASKARPATPAAGALGAGTELIAEEPQVIIIEATNALLVNATHEQHIKIATIIGYVDSEMLEESIPYKIYSLENQAPEDLAETLNKLIKETIDDKKGKIEKTVQRKEDEDIVIVPDENTFSIIVYASQKNQRWIANLIETLDKRRPQVLIDVMLVEITKDDTFQYDLDVVGAAPDLLTTSGAFSEVVGGATSALLGANRDEFLEYSSSGGTGKGFYADKHIQALLTLMQQKKYGRVLAQPKILVNDNETGTINTQTTTYVARSSSSTVAAGDAVVSETTTFDEFSSGIDLAITPHISEGQLLRLEIKMSRSEQDSASEGGTDAPPPDKKENNIETVVTVPDKSTIILGGMQQLNQDKGGKKVPFFGDIPLVGGLFRSVNNKDIQSKLYIFVKAYILRPGETGEGLPDLVRESGKFREAFEDSEKEFQEYEEWPGRESPPLNPLKVLEVR